ncbi:MAG: PBSX family phage terminase large subunit [Clostridia bacterium]|nr:PBSX family phage terminase large subunit [Clostridia bacterium]
MKFQKFSKKQLTVLNWWCNSSPFNSYDAIICDGAVRSGKTVCMSISFILWSFSRFSDSSFAICGKTITSLKRNVIVPLIPVLLSLGFSVKEKKSQNIIEIGKGKRINRYYLFGGRDESSASLIQGMTLCGVLLDEVALMPRSFVEQALARCSVIGSKFWFNCNPENPRHWFYTEWIKKAREKNCLYLHFLMNDNPSLSQNIIKRYEALYSGAFYERFVLGKWVAVDGLVYPFFNEKEHIAKTVPESCSQYYISCDYGTVNPASFGLWGLNNGVWYRLREFYHDSKAKGFQMTDKEYYEELVRLADNRHIDAVIVDPSAASFMECIRREGRFRVIPARNNVSDGIRQVSEKLKTKQILIGSSCEDSIREFSMYRWDANSVRDTPRKEYDHAMDDIRYFVATALTNTDNSFFALSVERT